MNLQQFRFVRETVRKNFNLTEAAKALYTSQPGVSKAIIEFEDELGVKIFERYGKRIKGLTQPGEQIIKIIERINLEVENLRKTSEEFAKQDEGSLVIACTHTQARYFLPKIIRQFREQFPKVHLSLVQGSPTSLAEMVLNDTADLAIATESLALTPGLVTLGCYEWEHYVIVPKDHPLETYLSGDKAIQLDDLSRFPIVTYEHQFSGRSSIDKAFREAGVSNDIVLEAIDADVIKTYVELGLGIGIIAGVAYQSQRDAHLIGIPAGHLFGNHTTRVGTKTGVFLRNYAYIFLQLLCPHFSTEEIKQELGTTRLLDEEDLQGL